MSGPLSGVRVIDLTTAVLGPLTTQILGDHGADVIKVETPDGDSMRPLGPSRSPTMSAMFMTNNRNKRSVVLDLKRPQAHEALMRLVRTADVFVHNMRHKATKKLGIAYDDLVKENPAVVYASATGYRLDGPLADRPAFDDVIQGWSGIPDLFLKSGREAQYAPFAAADKVVGYILASSIGMALFHREKTGEGQEVHVPMLETMVAFNLHEHLWGGAFDPPIGSPGYSRMGTPNRRPFETGDGYICVMPVTDAQWKRLLLALGRPDLAENDYYVKMENRGESFPELYGHVRSELTRRTTREWLEVLEANDVPCGPASTLEDLMEDEYLAAANFFDRYEHPTEGAMVTTAMPLMYSKSPGHHLRLPPPNLGEHTASILGELGYDEAEAAEISGGAAAKPA